MIRKTPGDVVSAMIEKNVLDGSEPALERPSGVDRVMVWSGWVEGTEGEPAWFRTSSAGAWERLLAWCKGAAAWAWEEGVRVWIRPRAEHVVSDAPRCMALARELGDWPIDIVLDPASMLTATMLGDGNEHVERIVSSLAGHPQVAALVLANVDDGGLAPVHAGRLDTSALGAVVREHWPVEKPVILLDREVEAQLAVLEG